MFNKLLILTSIFTIITSCAKYEDKPESGVVFTDVILKNHIEPIENAVVSIFAGNKRFSTETNREGKYSIVLPIQLLPDSGFISMSITHSRYKSIHVEYRLPLLPGASYGTFGSGQSMDPCPDCLEFEEGNHSELFHLGDDNFGGPINSQFQKSSDGLELAFHFKNSDSYKKLKVSFYAKGIESNRSVNPNMVIIGSDTARIPDSPYDGSFGLFSFHFENKEESKQIIIKTSQQRNSLNMDDWEFIALNVIGVR